MNTYSLPLEPGGAPRSSSTWPTTRPASRRCSRSPAASWRRVPGAPRRSEGPATAPTTSIQALGEIAGQGADHVVIAHKRQYRAGAPSRTSTSTCDRAGPGRDRRGRVVRHELEGVEAVVPTWPTRDVLAFMCHASRRGGPGVAGGHGATVDDPRAIRRKVVAARGEHELEAEITELWSMPRCRGPHRRGRPARTARTPRRPARVRAGRRLRRRRRRAGRHGALRGGPGGGLREPYRHRAQIQAASTLRNLGRTDERAWRSSTTWRHGIRTASGWRRSAPWCTTTRGGGGRRAGRPAHRGRGDQHRPGRRPLPPGADRRTPPSWATEADDTQHFGRRADIAA